MFYVVDVFELNLNKKGVEIRFFKTVLRFLRQSPALRWDARTYPI